MRMWKVDPTLLCRKHLLGEHLEMHIFANGMAEGNFYPGFVDGGLVELHSVDSRHEELVDEMTSRGYNHRSPIAPHYEQEAGQVNVAQNLLVLRERCQQCRERQDVRAAFHS
jgi:hypothetical protein